MKKFTVAIFFLIGLQYCSSLSVEQHNKELYEAIQKADVHRPPYGLFKLTFPSKSFSGKEIKAEFFIRVSLDSSPVQYIWGPCFPGKTYDMPIPVGRQKLTINYWKGYEGDSFQHGTSYYLKGITELELKVDSNKIIEYEAKVVSESKTDYFGNIITIILFPMVPIMWASNGFPYYYENVILEEKK